MAKVNLYQQDRLASSVVGTAGADTSAGNFAGNILEGAASGAAVQNAINQRSSAQGNSLLSAGFIEVNRLAKQYTAFKNEQEAKAMRLYKADAVSQHKAQIEKMSAQLKQEAMLERSDDPKINALSYEQKSKAVVDDYFKSIYTDASGKTRSPEKWTEFEREIYSETKNWYTGHSANEYKQLLDEGYKRRTQEVLKGNKEEIESWSRDLTNAASVADFTNISKKMEARVPHFHQTLGEEETKNLLAKGEREGMQGFLTNLAYNNPDQLLADLKNPDTAGSIKNMTTAAERISLIKDAAARKKQLINEAQEAEAGTYLEIRHTVADTVAETREEDPVRGKFQLQQIFQEISKRPATKENLKAKEYVLNAIKSLETEKSKDLAQERLAEAEIARAKAQTKAAEAEQRAAESRRIAGIKEAEKESRAKQYEAGSVLRESINQKFKAIEKGLTPGKGKQPKFSAVAASQLDEALVQARASGAITEEEYAAKHVFLKNVLQTFKKKDKLKDFQGTIDEEMAKFNIKFAPISNERKALLGIENSADEAIARVYDNAMFEAVERKYRTAKKLPPEYRLDADDMRYLASKARPLADKAYAEDKKNGKLKTSSRDFYK